MVSLETKSPKKSVPWLVIIAALPALAVLLWLGTWQMQRLAWKEGLLANINTRLAAEPVALPALLDQLDASEITQAQLDYLPVAAAGRLNHEAEQHFFATHQGISGYYVYTPLILAEPEGQIVFVNRGFVPFDLKEPATRPETIAVEEVQIEGLARQRLDEKPSWVVPDNDAAGNIYYWKDIALMAERAGYDEAQVVPFFIDQGSPLLPGTLGQWPVSGVTLVNLPNNHLQYAITWYGLALTLVGVVGFFVAGRLRGGEKRDNSV
ncbi:MAG: SURF1 family protein [Pseudomonadota bacterium]